MEETLVTGIHVCAEVEVDVEMVQTGYRDFPDEGYAEPVYEDVYRQETSFVDSDIYLIDPVTGDEVHVSFEHDRPLFDAAERLICGWVTTSREGCEMIRGAIQARCEQMADAWAERAMEARW